MTQAERRLKQRTRNIQQTMKRQQAMYRFRRHPLTLAILHANRDIEIEQRRQAQGLSVSRHGETSTDESQQPVA